VVIGLPDKDNFNANQPKDDLQFATYVQYPTLPVIINSIFLGAVNSVLNASLATLAPTNYPRTDIVAAALTGFPGLNLQKTGATPGDMLRLNTSITAVPRTTQNTLGVIGGDFAGYPNGRRLGDDVVDILLRVFMGKLCYIPSLPYCNASQAPVGNVTLIDGAPITATSFLKVFPYLRPPPPGNRPYKNVRSL